MANAEVRALDPGLGADLLAAIAEGNAQRAAVHARIGDLRDVSGLGDLLSATRVRSAILDCAAGAAETCDSLESVWSTVHSAITESAWHGIAIDPERWRGEFVAERIERPLAARPRPELSSTPPSRFHSFSHPEVVPTARTFRIPGESLSSLTFAGIERCLAGARPSAVIECAARWRYLASVLDSSVNVVQDLVETRCGNDACVAATGVGGAIQATRRVAAGWVTTGNAIHSFGLGLRHAVEALAALRSEHDDVVSRFEGNFFDLAQRPAVEEQFQRRARAVFDETYSAGLFALVVGLAMAGAPRADVGIGLDVGGTS